MAQYKDAKKVAYLQIGPEKSVQVSFLQEPYEWDFKVEHSSPDAWYKSALCTYDTGECYACEQQLREWNQRIAAYVPVLHHGKLKWFRQGMGVNSVIHGLMDYFREHGTIKDTEFIISRNGSGKRSKYLVFPVDNSTPLAYNGTIGTNKIVKAVAYEKQAEYYK